MLLFSKKSKTIFELSYKNLKFLWYNYYALHYNILRKIKLFNEQTEYDILLFVPYLKQKTKILILLRHKIY